MNVPNVQKETEGETLSVEPSLKSSIYSTKANTANTEPMLNAILAPSATTPLLDGALDEGGAVEFVPFNCIARDWNAAKLLFEVATALTANTMPAPQWLEPSGECCLQ